MGERIISWLCIAFVFSMLGACATPVPTDAEFGFIDDKNLPEPDFSANITGLSSCTNSHDKTIRLNSNEPVIVIVHGCFGSAALFRSLAQVFAFHADAAPGEGVVGVALQAGHPTVLHFGQQPTGVETVKGAGAFDHAFHGATFPVASQTGRPP